MAFWRKKQDEFESMDEVIQSNGKNGLLQRIGPILTVVKSGIGHFQNLGRN